MLLNPGWNPCRIRWIPCAGIVWLLSASVSSSMGGLATLWQCPCFLYPPQRSTTVWRPRTSCLSAPRTAMPTRWSPPRITGTPSCGWTEGLWSSPSVWPPLHLLQQWEPCSPACCRMGTFEELLVGQRPLPIPHCWLLHLPGCEVGEAFFL